ncbi:MAG: fibronectin type III domain-containing protein [Planctomycetota bacterium]|jgi:hypothetical protein
MNQPRTSRRLAQILITLAILVGFHEAAWATHYPFGNWWSGSSYSGNVNNNYGYKFRVTGHGVRVTHLGVRPRFTGGCQVRLWDEGGNVLRETTWADRAANQWHFIAITPVNLAHNTDYRVSVRLYRNDFWPWNDWYYRNYTYRSGWTGDSNIVSNGGSGRHVVCYASGFSFPSSTYSSTAFSGAEIGYLYAPKDFTVPRSDDDGAYTLTWSSVNNCTGYTIEEHTNASYTSLTNTYSPGSAATSQSISGKNVGETHYFRIRADFGGSSSNWRNCDNPCVTGRVFVPEQSTTGSYVVSWTPFPSVSSYVLEESSDNQWGGSTTTDVINNIGTSFYQITGNSNGTFYYRVQPMGASSTWIYGTNGCVIGAPEAPGSLTVPAQSHTGQFRVDWSSSVGAVKYELQEFTAEGFSTPYRVYYGSNLTFNVTGKTAGRYFYRVRAENGAGFSGWEFSSNGCSIVPPPPPDSLSVDPVSRDGKIQTSWAVVDGATAYELQEDRSSTFDVSPVSVFLGNGTSHLVIGKTSGTYYYRVRSINGAGAGAWRTAPNGCQIAPPYAPTNVVVPSTNATGSFLVTWDTIDGALFYEVEEDTDPAFSAPALVYDGPIAALSRRGVPDGTYSYRVRAGNGAGVSDWTAGGNACVVARALPGPPGALTVPISSSSGNYSILWGNAAGAIHYEVEEAPDIDFSGAVLIASCPGTTLYVTGRNDGNFYYRVRAVNPLGRSAWTTGLNPCVVWITTMVPYRMEVGHANPGDTFERSGAARVPMLHIRFTAGAKDAIQLEDLTIDIGGTGADHYEVTEIAMWRDENANGLLDSGEPKVDPNMPGFPADNGSAVFDLTVEPAIPAGEEVHYLVTASFASTTAHGGTFQITIPSPFNITAHLDGSPSVPADIPSTDPDLVGGVKTIVDLGAGSLRVFPGPNTPESVHTTSPADLVPMLQFSLAASSVEGVDVDEIRFVLVGMAGAPPVGLRLFEDVNGDGKATTEDVELGAAAAQTGDEWVAFDGLALSLDADQARTFLVTGGFAQGSGVYSIGIESYADVLATGQVTKLGIVAAGAPVLGAPQFIVPPPAPRESGGCGGGPRSRDGWLGWLLLIAAGASLLAFRFKGARSP